MNSKFLFQRFFPVESKELNKILFGIALFYTQYVLFEYIFIGNKFLRIVCLASISIFLWGLFSVRRNLNGVDKIIKPICYFYSFICLVNIVIGITIIFFQGQLFDYLFNIQYLWMYVIGFIVFIPIKVSYLKTIFNWSILFLFGSLLFSLYFFGDFFIHPESVVDSNSDGFSFSAFLFSRPQEPAFLLIPFASFLCFFPKISVKNRVIFFIAFILALLSSLFAGRRTASLTIVVYVFISLFVWLWINPRKVWVYLLSAIVVIHIMGSFVSSKGLLSFFEDTFVILSERFDTDTRRETEGDFYYDMNNVSDWIIGRGMNGTYKSPALASLDKMDRSVIETGYLNIILHGGLVMLTPYLLMLFYAFFVGFFKSNNYWIKNCSLIILFNLLLLYPGGTPKLTMQYLLLFVFLRICISKKWRQMSNSDVEKIFFLNKMT